jgi:hypothetical protein
LAEEAGLLACEKEGRTRIYRVDQAKLDLVREWLAWFDEPARGRQAKRKRSDGAGDE